MAPATEKLSRRGFIQRSALATGAFCFGPAVLQSAGEPLPSSLTVADLPKGAAPKPVAAPHFPDRLHAFVWRNWALVPAVRMARVIGAEKADILRLGRSMGLPGPPRITRAQQHRSFITVIKRNWHLLPYEQLLELLDWTPGQMAYTLREDDFLYVKLGNLKPACEPLRFAPPAADASRRAGEMARVLREEFPGGWPEAEDPLFGFVDRLTSRPPAGVPGAPSADQLRFCSSYFALYGDPLLEPDADPYPDGYLARLAHCGVSGVWLQGVLNRLAPFPWQPGLSARSAERLANLGRLVSRARRRQIGVYLYLNEPRSLPLRFFESHPELKGVVEGDHAALCTSQPEVQQYLRASIAAVCRAVPDLAGFFTISASENLTNCWSHGGGASCPRCGQRSPADVIAEVNRLIGEGIQQSRTNVQAATKPAADTVSPGPAATRPASGPGRNEPGTGPELIVWDWGWNDAWAEGIIAQLPRDVSLMSVSEWKLPITRGGVPSEVGEYSISAVGPGPRALRHWKMAREHGLRAIAKIQAGNSWELSAVPYLPALENVARHAANLRAADLDGLMLGWTLGGYPSPNLEVVAEFADLPAGTQLSPGDALQRVAERRFGRTLAPPIVAAWCQFSASFSEFPFHVGVVYSAPLQVGPANPVWETATGYAASMVGFPYDHLDGWRAVYPPEVFIQQLQKTADGFAAALEQLAQATRLARLSRSEQRTLDDEVHVAAAAGIHFRSVANQARFILARRELATANNASSAKSSLEILEQTLQDEIALARRLCQIQSRDSRIGFEASNQYYYVPLDLAEKILNCRDLLDRWLPAQKKRWP